MTFIKRLKFALNDLLLVCRVSAAVGKAPGPWSECRVSPAGLLDAALPQLGGGPGGRHVRGTKRERGVGSGPQALLPRPIPGVPSTRSMPLPGGDPHTLQRGRSRVGTAVTAGRTSRSY